MNIWNACLVYFAEFLSNINPIFYLIFNVICMGFCVCSLRISRVMIMKILICHLIIIMMKLERWNISQRSGSGNISAVCHFLMDGVLSYKVRKTNKKYLGQMQYSKRRDRNCLALVPQMMRAFGMNSKVGVRVPPSSDMYRSLLRTITYCWLPDQGHCWIMFIVIRALGNRFQWTLYSQ